LDIKIKLKSIVESNNVELKDAILTSGLVFNNNIWFSKENKRISHPESGNEECYEIEDQSYWFIHRNSILKSVIQRYSNGKLFFDVGGGNGYVTKALLDLGFDAYLIEPGIAGIKNAEKRGVSNLINSTLEDCHFKSGSIFNIGLFDVLEHIEDDISFIKLVNKLLANDGMVFISVPAYQILWSEEDSKAGHYKRYSAKALANLLMDCGFSIEYRSYFFSFLVPFIFLFRTVPGIIFRNKIKQRPEKDHISPSGFINKLIKLFTRFESSIINRNLKIKIGSSLIIVAKKQVNDLL
jgi:2-polyprenyl-3-methyl-5-hydroxy-6-metoxy-1,4-benzoquinol methylase